MTTILDRAALCVATRPPAIEGQGGNATTFGVASLLVWGFGLSPDEAMGIMLQYNARCEPPWSQRELTRMLASALTKGGDKPRGHMVGEGKHELGTPMEIEPEKPKRKKAVFSLEALRQAQEPGLPTTIIGWKKWLADRCEYDLPAMTATQVLDGLYRPGEVVLVFNRMWGTQGDWARVIGKQWYQLGPSPDAVKKPVDSCPAGSPEGMHWLMQPVTGGWRRKVGSTEMSRRTAQNVMRWPYILLESDTAPHELWLNVLVRMKIRVVAIMSSGGRSLHAVVRLDKETEEELKAELEHPDNVEVLSLIGCDPQAMKTMVYPRLPNTYREGKRMGVRGDDGKVKRDNKGRAIMRFAPFEYGRTNQSLLYYQPGAQRGQSIAERVRFEPAE